MPIRRFEFKEGGSRKFWQILQSGRKFTVQYGRIGTDGRTNIKTFDTPSAAKKEAEKLVAQKLKKGYIEISSSQKALKDKSRSTPRRKPKKRESDSSRRNLKRRTRVTQPPPLDVTKLLPELANRSKTTVRLHPQSGKVSDLAASKLGGKFLWPKDEPWPTCEDSCHPKRKRPTFVPILQLAKDDIPELGFPKGTNLFQLIWCPTRDHLLNLTESQMNSRVYWRDTTQIHETGDIFDPVHQEDGYVPRPCWLTPERVVEYPDIGDLSLKVQNRLVSQELNATYQFELSTCPSTKVGGYPGWVQDPYKVVCSKKHKMEFLLQLPDVEYNQGQRWVPEADQQNKRSNFNPTNFDFRHSVVYVFICRKCKGLPIRTVIQH